MLSHQSKEHKIVFHKGVYKKTATTAEAVFMITGMTIGAGILGLPYAIAQVGVVIGIVYIVFLGIIILFLNLMIGEIATRTSEPLQLPGLAGKYLGSWAKKLLSFTFIASCYGALLAYVVGEGELLYSIFGGSKLMWSIIFWVIAGSIVYRGLEMAKTVQKILSSVVLMLLIGLSLYLLPDIKTTHLNYTVWGQLFFPYGIILFALHSSPAIIEAHALLPGQHLKFKRALILGTLIPMVVYILFVIAIVGVMGAKTSPIAMLGLGELYGEKFLLFGNLFAILAMSTAFVGLGIALKQTLIWDNKVPRKIAIALVLGVPLIGLLLGLRSFVTIINVVGGVFVSVQALTMTLLYWKAKHQRVLRPAPYNLHHLWLFITPVFLVFLAMTCYTVVKLLNSMV